MFDLDVIQASWTKGITVKATPSQVAHPSFAIMLLGDDVVDLEWSRDSVVGQLAVFASMAGSLAAATILRQP